MGTIIGKATSPRSIEADFELCFDLLPVEVTALNPLLTEKFKMDGFVRLLLKTDLEVYAELLYRYVLSHNIKDAAVISDDESIQLTTALNFLFSNDFDDVELNIKSVKKKSSSLVLKGENISKCLLASLISNYEEIGLNLEPLTYAEAKQIVSKYSSVNFNKEDCDDSIDIEWLSKYEYESPEVKRMDKMLISIGLVRVPTVPTEDYNYYSTEMVERYASEHKIKREVTKELISRRLAELEAKPGAKPKNDGLSQFVEKVSYLMRMNRFLKQDDIVDIEQFPIRNQDCCLIHDLLVFFDLIDDQRSREHTSTTPEAYIKSLIRNYRKSRKPEIQRREYHYLVEKTINGFKQMGFVTFYFNLE